MTRVEEDGLRAIVRGSRWFLAVLETVRDSALPDAWVGAGALRDLVWGTLHDGFEVARVRDVDVAYFDAADLRRERDDEADTLLRSLRPDVPWEAKNQAAVHTWYAARFGGAPYPPARSIEEAIGSWPETATAVVVRMEEDGRLAICAPLGLSDLLEGVWRRNPSQVTVEQSRDRLARHRISERWPRVRVIPPDA